MAVTTVDNTNVSRVENENITVRGAPSYTAPGAEEATAFGTIQATISSSGASASRTWSLAVSDGTYPPTGTTLSALLEFAKDMRDTWQQVYNDISELMA